MSARTPCRSSANVPRPPSSSPDTAARITSPFSGTWARCTARTACPHGDHAGLHVAGAPGHDTVDTVDRHQSGLERIAAPCVRIARRDDVGVTVEQEGRPGAVAGEGRGHPDRCLALHLHARELGIALQCRHVDVPPVHGEAVGPPALGHVLLRSHLGGAPADRRDAQQVQQIGKDGALVDRGG